MTRLARLLHSTFFSTSLLDCGRQKATIHLTPRDL